MEDVTVIKHNLKIFKTEEEYLNKLAQINDDSDSDIDFILDNPHVVLIEDENEKRKVRYYESVKKLEDYFTIVGMEDIQVKFTQDIYYHGNDGWVVLKSGDYVNIKSNKKMRFKMTSPTFDHNNDGENDGIGIGTFVVKGSKGDNNGLFNIEGNVMSLYYGENFLTQTKLPTDIFKNLFKDCTGLLSAKYLNLPALSLSDNCYEGMFYNCTLLNEAPQLPATKLGISCYKNMFYNCTSLKESPRLPATILLNANYCYEGMFYNCTSLNEAPQLPATSLSISCYKNMFYKCTSLKESPQLPATELTDNCYDHMFYGCEDLFEVDDIKAQTLATECCANMFEKCTSLVYVPILYAKKLANKCYYDMFCGCTSLTKAPTIEAEELASYCCAYMFEGCTKLRTAPELPAMKLSNNCYEGMFYGCTNLNLYNYILPATELSNSCYLNMFKKCENLINPPELPATLLKEYCYANMFAECSSLQRAPKLPATELSKDCYFNMFNSCIRLVESPELLALTLVDNCYGSMFNGCESLNKIKMLATGEINESCLENWAVNVSENLKFIKNVCILKEKFPEGSISEGWDIDEYCQNVPSFINLSKETVSFYKSGGVLSSEPDLFNDAAYTYGYVGELKNIIGDFDDSCVSINKITVYSRGHDFFNGGIPVWCTLFVKNEYGNFELAYQSPRNKTMIGLEDGDEFSFDMECKNETYKCIKSTDKICIVYLGDPNNPQAQIPLGFKTVGSMDSDEMRRPGGLTGKFSENSTGDSWWRPAFCIEYTPYSKVYTPNADNDKPKYSNGALIGNFDLLNNILPINDININIVYAVDDKTNEIIGNTILENYKWSSMKSLSDLITELSESSDSDWNSNWFDIYGEYGDIINRIIIIIKDDNNINLT